MYSIVLAMLPIICGEYPHAPDAIPLAIYFKQIFFFEN
jgi:hypothetical protein